MKKTKMPGHFDSRLDQRIALIEALSAVSNVVTGSRNVDAVALAETLDAAARQLWPSTPPADDSGQEADDPRTLSLAEQYSGYALLTRALAHLVRWVHAIRSAEIDGDRHRRAAHVLAADAKRYLTARACVDEKTSALIEAANAIDRVLCLDDVSAPADLLTCAPIPLPWLSSKKGLRVPRVRAGQLAPSDDLDFQEDEELPPPVAFLTFWINGVIVADPQLIRPDVIYDLELRAQLSRWPTEWDRVEFVPLHVEPAGTLDIPVFRFYVKDIPRVHSDAPLPDGPVTLVQRGRLRVHAPMDLLARPLEVQYVSTVTLSVGGEPPRRREGRQATDVLSVQGQRRIGLQSFDPTQNPITGFGSIDSRIHDIRDAVRREGLPDEELKNFLTLLAAMGRISAEAIIDDIYPDVWSEHEFQQDVRGRLRATPTIGGQLEEHPHAAGGATDLSFHKIRLELKTQDDSTATVPDVIQRYGQQTVQYVAGSDRRAGVLAVLDTTEKTSAPGDAGNDIEIRVFPPPHGTGVRSLLLGVVIVRGNLATPSDLSRRRSATTTSGQGRGKASEE